MCAAARAGGGEVEGLGGWWWWGGVSLLCHVVDQDDPVRTTVVGGGERTESFLACSVPHLQLHCLAIHFDRRRLGPTAKVGKTPAQESGERKKNTRALKSTPMVDLEVDVKVLSTNRVMRHVLPTPASPTTRSLNVVEYAPLEGQVAGQWPLLAGDSGAGRRPRRRHRQLRRVELLLGVGGNVPESVHLCKQSRAWGLVGGRSSQQATSLLVGGSGLEHPTKDDQRRRIHGASGVATK